MSDLKMTYAVLPAYAAAGMRYELAPDIAQAATRVEQQHSAVYAALAPQTRYVTPSEPLAEPVFNKALVTAKGVLSHVHPVEYLFHNVHRDVLDLRDQATGNGGADSRSLIQRINAFLSRYLEDAAELTRLGVATPALGQQFRRQIAADLYDAAGTTRIPFRFDAHIVQLKETDSEGKQHNAESALFSVGKTLADDVSKVEALRGALIALRRRHQQTVEDLRARLAALEADIPGEIRRLDVLERERVEVLDDYAVAQRLLAEHWREVEAAHAERRRIIDDHRGLFYVRVRETPLGRTLPDPLELRPASPQDLVPGCGGGHRALPAALLAFMDAVRAIPANDWAGLRPLRHLLPGREVLAGLVDARRQRLSLQLNHALAFPSLPPLLAGIAQQNDALARQVAALPFNASALSGLQLQGGAILALDDLFAIPSPLLRDPARALHQRLEAAAGCLLERLGTIAPSIRLEWADAAADDRLAVDAPERWPRLADAEQRDFNGVRTLVELVAWWFRQLDAEASAAARTTMRNLVRACLLLAASDDPQQLVQGSLRTLPGRFRIGDALRLTLNREAAPGTLLQLFDTSQRVVATLRVDDHDAQGTLASVANIFEPRLEREAAVVLGAAARVSGVNQG